MVVDFGGEFKLVRAVDQVQMAIVDRIFLNFDGVDVHRLGLRKVSALVFGVIFRLGQSFLGRSLIVGNIGRDR